MKVVLLSLLFMTTVVSAYSSNIGQKVDSLLSVMTLQEKIGQMNQVSGIDFSTGPWNKESSIVDALHRGEYGSVLNIHDPEEARRLQTEALRSRLGIPLLFGLDVIHGMSTIFPIPLAESASFDLAQIRQSSRFAAVESALCGVHWTFAPMLDVARDARWGRVMEGSGEDTYWAAQVAEARVKGLQGEDGDSCRIVACAKHFVGYGAVVAGRDYNNVDMSVAELYNFYLPPFKAAVEAGVGSIMTAFNDMNNVPCTGNKEIVRGILRDEWHYDGVVVSDWCSVAEMCNHRYAADQKDAALKAIAAGVDIDMVSRCYAQYLEELVAEGRVDVAEIDRAVGRILELKYRLGLFDDPFCAFDSAGADAVRCSPAMRKAARDMAKRSIVLLKNDSATLPLKNIKSVALIGELCRSKVDMMGNWSANGDAADVVTLEEAFLQRNIKTNYAKGFSIDNDECYWKEAVNAAKHSDVVIVAVGERGRQSGEDCSRGELTLPDNQQKLIGELKKAHKPVVVLVMGGRPLIFNLAAADADALMVTWWLGSEAGNAITDVLFGEYNPSGRLPMTFPAHIAQLPIYYNQKSTGRPLSEEVSFIKGYIDIPYKPAYPFGFGLGYTTFSYSVPKMDKSQIGPLESATLTVTVTNSGQVEGEEVLQLYVSDCVASITRPVRELKGVQKIRLRAGESRTLVFDINEAILGFYDNAAKYVVEEGFFDVMVGPNSNDLQKCQIEYKL
ncbi:MAG: glycoside hydrolase family 3 N-terminal domain-containing protein [Tidjanibacter sp.]|nr:glycoside hydrolase family 3 N-terminal domain-containing protein [Tidjanibacter sp.]